MVIKGPAAAALALLLAACAQPAPEQSQPAAQPTAQAPAESTTPSPGAAQPPAGARAQPSTLQPPAAERGEAAAPAQAPASAEAGRRPAAAREQAPSEGSRAAAESARPAETAAADTASPPPPAKKVPEFREVTIPAGTEIAVRLSTPLASDKNTVEDRVRGTVTSPIRVGGVTAIPAGSVITGTVREVNRSGRVKGRAVIAYGFERLEIRDETHSISTGLVRHEAEPDRSDDVKKGAIGGAAGAIIGGIAGGGKGAAIGAAIGGAGTVMVTRGDEVRLEPGTTVRTTLREPLTVRVPVN